MQDRYTTVVNLQKKVLASSGKAKIAAADALISYLMENFSSEETEASTRLIERIFSPVVVEFDTMSVSDLRRYPEPFVIVAVIRHMIRKADGPVVSHSPVWTKFVDAYAMRILRGC